MKIMMTIILALILCANFYVFFRLWHLIPAGTFLRPALIVFAVTAVPSLFLVLLIGNKFPLAVSSFLYILGTSWFFIMLYLLMVFLLLDISRLFGASGVGRILFANWTSLALLTALMAVIFTGGYLRYLNKDRVELNLALPEGKELLRPLKIVAISDLHLGYGIGRNEFSRWVERINAEEPDLVLLGGDLIDNSARPLLERDVASVFRRIRSTYGVYAVLGNHEYIAGIQDALAFLAETGITILRDSVVEVGGVYLAGRDDRSNQRRKPVSELTAGLDPLVPVILLDHQPYQLGEAESNGVTFQFSGHTHRGQVWPVSWITDGMYELSHGYMRKGDTHYYVSSGMGIWGGKFRIGTRSEYVVVRFGPDRPAAI